MNCNKNKITFSRFFFLIHINIVPFSISIKQYASDFTTDCGILNIKWSLKVSSKVANGNISFINCLTFSSFSALESLSEFILTSNVYHAPYKSFSCCVEPTHLLIKVN